MARFDILRAVCHLACFITKWSTDCDKRLHRLVCYIHSTKHFRMIGWIGDDLRNLQPHMFADADFAGCTGSLYFGIAYCNTWAQLLLPDCGL